MSRLLPLTARISQDDLEFLSKIDVEGARSTGDKVRHIIGEARQRREGQADYNSAFRMLKDMLEPTSNHIRLSENLTGRHSEVIDKLLGWLPDIMAYIISSEVKPDDKDGGNEGLEALEKGLAKKVFLLLESVLRMGVTSSSSCYNESIISENLEPLLQLCSIIESSRKNNRGGN